MKKPPPAPPQLSKMERTDPPAQLNPPKSPIHIPPPPLPESLHMLLPDIQDRKCILGCLASILSSHSTYFETDIGTSTNFHKKDSNSPEMHKFLERQYQFFCDFLEQCALLLYLESSQARAFFPMLQRVMKVNEEQVHIDSNTSSGIISSESSSMFSENNTDDGDAAAAAAAANTSTTITPLTQGTNTSPLFQNRLIQPFLQTLTPKSGFPCLTLLLSQYLLHSKSGYDARTRYAFKQLFILIIIKEYDISAGEALWKFEGLEVYIANKLLEHHTTLQENEKQNHGGSDSNIPPEEETGETNSTTSKNNSKSKFKNRLSKPKKEVVLRTLKISTAGVLAGTLFGITGGLAAPGIAAGLAAFAGSAATATTLVALTSSSTMISVLFGVGGGGLAAYKTHRRTKGLTEFTVKKETTTEISEKNDTKNHGKKVGNQEGRNYLHCVVCMTGWLRDIHDFQRPWGVTPTHPPLNEIEKLQRFYAKINPQHVGRSQTIAKKWKGEEKELFELIKNKYGVDPDGIWDNEEVQYGLTGEEEGKVLELLIGMGVKVVPKSVREIREDLVKKRAKQQIKENVDFKVTPLKSRASSSSLSPPTTSSSPNSSALELTPPDLQPNDVSSRASTVSTTSMTVSTSTTTSPSSATTNTATTNTATSTKKTIRPPWSFTHTYSGELYTIRFESLLLLELCDSVTDLAVDLVGTATKEILKQTAMHAFMTAIALPVALVNAANMIDGTWTIAIERAEQAGLELAKLLVSRKAGCRPVTLVGFSMGARAMYVCLKELARLQEEWIETKDNEDMREPATVVENVVLMGMPNHLSLGSWASVRRVVSGRVINCYSSKDWILSLMFQYKRLSGLGRRVCGTSKVQVPGVENYNVTSLIHSHTDYCSAVEDILKLVEFGLPRDFVNKNNQVEKCEDDDEIEEDEEDNGGFKNEELKVDNLKDEVPTTDSDRDIR